MALVITMRPPECEKCGKHLYPNAAEAKAALQHYRRNGWIKQGRIYPSHGGWHLTHWPSTLQGKPGRATGTLADNDVLQGYIEKLKEEGHNGN